MFPTHYSLLTTHPERGQALLVAVTMFLFIGLLITLGVAGPLARDEKNIHELEYSTGSFVTALSGQEDVTYRVRRGKQYSATEVLSLNGAFATTTTSDDVTTGIKTVHTDSDLRTTSRSATMGLLQDDVVSFNYGMQAGNGGFVLENTSSVLGNVYANGNATGTGSSLIQGDLISAGASGKIEGIHATSTARAHTIKDSSVDRDAYYQTLINTTVLGTLHPGSSDQAPQPFPISDATLDEWETDAANGGTISSPCPYVITTDTTIGPKKINCELQIKGATVTLSGMLWVVGNIDIKTTSVIKLDSSLGKKSVAMIADNPADRTNSSQFIIRNKTTFNNSGTDGSFVTVVSRNTSAENGGSVNGIELQQSAEGEVLMYSNHGKLLIEQSSKLREATGYGIELQNSSQIQYKSGLASALFETGPGGSWDVTSWLETQ